MKVKKLIELLSKHDPEATVGTFADKKYDFMFTPIEESFKEDAVELHEDFRGKGKKVYRDYVVLVGCHQSWNEWPHNKTCSESELERLRTENAAMREALGNARRDLKTYGNHIETCALPRKSYGCVCGLSESLTAITKALESHE